MNKYQEYKHHKEQSIKSGSNLHDLLKVLHEFGPDFGKLEQPDHLEHSDYLRQLAYPGEPCDPVYIGVRQDEIKGDY